MSESITTDLPRLRRVRWGVRATLSLGVAASVAANILHADPHPVSQAIAAWPPLALLLTVELISRVPVHRRSLAALRLGAIAAIAGIAAWVSYWHMTGVAARYGETGASPYLLPLSVDGLVVVASVCLVELAGRIRELEEPAPETKHLPARSEEVLHGADTPLPVDSGYPSPQEPAPVVVPPAEPVPVQVTAPTSAPAVPEPVQPARASAPKPRRTFAQTQRAAAALESDGLSVAQISAALAIGERQVRKALRPVPVGGSAVGSDDG